MHSCNLLASTSTHAYFYYTFSSLLKEKLYIFSRTRQVGACSQGKCKVLFLESSVFLCLLSMD